MKRFFAFVICGLMMLGALSLTACCFNNTNEEAASEGLTYELNEKKDGYIVTGMGTCTDTRIVIPSTYNGLPVMSIAKGAFQAALPPVKEQPSEDNDKDKYKDKDAKLYPNVKPLLEPTTDNGGEKPEASITEIVIPDSVMDIGDEAFYGCEQLSSFEVSDLINLIGTDAFKNTAYYLDEANWTDGALYLEEYLVEVRTTVSGGFTVREGTVNIASSAFEGCSGITTVSFPPSLRFVGNMAFLGCTGISEVDLAISGIQIGSNAFEGCTALAAVKIATDDVPNAPPVESYIGMGTDRADDVFMPGGSMDLAFDPTADPALIYSASIGNRAFKDCTSLTTVTLGSNVGYISGYIFEGCTSLTFVDMSMITASDPSTAIVTPGYNYRWHMSLTGVFKDCTSLKGVKLPQGIQWLQRTFEGCTSLTEFTVPDTVKGLNETFSRCTSLTDVVIPDSVLALSRTFSGCTSLTDVVLPETLVKLGDHTFSGCQALSGVYVPDSVTEIGERVFPYTDNWNFNVSIGKGVKSIGREAVYNEIAVIYRGTMEQWGKIDLHETWNGMEGYDGNGKKLYVDIICADGTIVDGGTHTESMRGILLSDGTLYGRFLDVTVKSYADSRDEIVLHSLEELEAELKSNGADGWRYVSAAEILQMSNEKNFMMYDRVRSVARHYSMSNVA